MKKFASVLLVLCLTVLCSCGNEDGARRIEQGYGDYETVAPLPRAVTLYYGENGRILAFSGQVVSDGLVFKDVMELLLSGSEGYKSSFSGDVQLRSVTLMQNVLYIDLSERFLNMPTESFFECLAVMTHTFCAFSQVDFINVTVEGRQLTAPESGKPIMLLSEKSGSPAELAGRYRQMIAVENIYTAVYVRDQKNTCTVPETVSVTVTDGDYASALARATVTAPDGFFDDGFSLDGQPEYEDGTVRVNLIAPNGWKEENNWLGAEAMANTLSCLYPDALSFAVKISDRELNVIAEKTVKTTDAFSTVRWQAPITVPSAGGKISSSYMSAVPVSDGELVNFLNSYITAVAPNMPKNAVNAVTVSGDTVIVDLGKEYFEYYGELSPKDEYATVYALINTVCSYTETNEALILEDHRLRKTFSSNIALDNPLLPLPEKYIGALK